jgi:hypothetical protein
VNQIKAGGLSLIFFGFLIAVWSAQNFMSTRTFIANTGKAVGEIEELIPHASTGGGSVYYPRIRFVNALGQSVEFVGSVGTNPSPYHVGDRLNVAYDLHSPAQAKVYDFLSLWFLPITLGVIGTVFFIIGSCLLLVMNYRTKKMLNKGRN